MGTILLIFIIGTYRKRFFITFWLMKQRRKYKSMEKKDMSYLYDVFISYSHDDHSWVTTELIPELEMKNPKLKVCIHERDFKVSNILLKIYMYRQSSFQLQVGITVTENIVECIYRSQKFLMILSNSFLKSQWCNFETHVAQHQLTEMGRYRISKSLLENQRFFSRYQLPFTLYPPESDYSKLMKLNISTKKIY